MQYNIDFTIASLLVLSFLLCHFLRNGRETLHEPWFFLFVMLYVLALGVLDTISSLVLADPVSALDTCTDICSAYLCFEVMAAALFMLYLPLTIYGVTSRERGWLRLALVPALAMVLLIIFWNGPTGLFFHINADHRYVTGPAAVIIQGCAVFYLAFALGITLHNRKRIEPFKMFSILVMMLIGIAGLVLQAWLWDIRLVVVTYAFIALEMYLSFLVPEKRFDTLTGLYGRRAFATETHKLLHRDPDRRFAIVYSNIKEFKAINELHGEDVGDFILSEIGREWKKFVGDEATACRLHDDRFAICMPADALDIASLLDLTSDVSMLKHFQVNVHMAFGFYVIDDTQMSVGLMCDRARLALDSIGDSRVRRYAFYRAGQDEEFIEQHAIVDEMERSLEESRFEVYLQPIYDLQTREVAAAEALIRWHHPDRGLLPPSEFIPSFERNGMVTKLDRFVWESVCALQRHRIDSGLPTVPITANVSRADIDGTLAATILEMLARYALPAGKVCFEITESICSEDEEAVRTLVNTLRAGGAPVLLDDFGTGCSSLAVLESMSVDYLKMDREFLTNIDSEERARRIAASMIELAGDLGLSVIAEGIETEDMAVLLAQMGSHFGQGYLFSRPVPIADFEQMLLQKSDVCPPGGTVRSRVAVSVS